jgi:hypothetical protein
MATKAKMCNNDEIIELSEEIDEFGEDELSDEIDNLKLDVDELVTEGDITWINETIKNKYDNSPFRIPLRNRKGIIVDYSLVDEDDYEKVMKYKWRAVNGGYASGHVKNKSIRLHHFILGKPSGLNIIDHKNGDKLNNTKLNIHEKSKNFNSQNRTKVYDEEKHTSKFKGVCYNPTIDKYCSQASVNKKNFNLGYFEKEEDAAIAYDKYTYKVYGKHANNNKLITYEETIDIDINTLIKNRVRDLPNNISIVKNKYYIKKLYNKINYGKGVAGADTLEEALVDLENVNIKINRIKLVEELNYLQTPILRNKDGIAVIKIKLPNSKEEIDILVDDKLWHKLTRIVWAFAHGYANNNKLGLLHRYLKNAKEGEIVDHANRNIYDNRLFNLRIVPHSVNNHNKTKSKNSSSKYNGVSYCKRDKKWQAQIHYNNKKFYLGDFKKEIDAAKAYNKKAIELYGEFANLNVFDD